MKIRQRTCLFTLLLGMLATLNACDALSDLENKVQEFQATANAVETSLQQGLDLIETGQAIVTNIEGSGVGQTALALATGFQESGLLKTAQSVATEKGPELLQTVQYFASQQVPILKGTAQAIATRYPSPSDFPVMEGEKSSFQSSPDYVSYRIDAKLQDVVEYYKNEMPNSGWDPIISASVINENGALIHYEKHDRKAVLAINIDPDTNYTIVQITIQDG